MIKKAEKIDKTLELLDKAVKKAPPDSVYAKRIALIADYVEPLRDLSRQLSKGREKARQIFIIRHENKDLILGTSPSNAWNRILRH